MQQQTIDLGYVMGNTLANLSWTGFTLVCALAVIGIACFLLPFAVFGVKRRLDAIESAQRHQTELLTTELRRTNELLARRVVTTPAAAEPADPWHGVPGQSGYAEPPRAVASAAQFRAAPALEPAPAPLPTVVIQATQPAQYAPYPDDPRPAAPQPRRDVRWTRFARQGANGSAA